MEREEAIKIVKNHYPANKQMLNEALEFLIPELKKSEDERIRGAIIDHLKDHNLIEWAAWLKKQESVGEIVERCKNSWYNEGKIAGRFEGLTDDEKYQQGWHDALEKQGGQKPVNKVDETTIAVKDPDAYRIGFADGEAHAKEEMNTWSEEDETGWTNTMIMIKEVASNHYTKDSIKLVINWLESLKERIEGK